MSKKMENSKSEKKDPLDELNEIQETVESIETEKDPLDLIEQNNADDIPYYDSEFDYLIFKENQVITKEGTLKTDEIDDKPATKNQTNTKKDENIRKASEEILQELQPQKKTEKTDKTKKENKKETKKEKPKPDNKKDKTGTETTTKTIGNVKVDENGMPLINQFDTEKINKLNIFNNSKHNIKKIAGIVIGLCIMGYGIIQALNDVTRISDNVMYGEHETMAIAFIATGLLIIVLSFYKEIIRHLNLTEETRQIKTEVKNKTKTSPPNDKPKK